MGYEGSIATYSVTLGFHCVMLRVLHVSRSVGQIHDQKIGIGTFGEIYEKNLVSDSFVSKRKTFK
jgi:hypothetical protein